MFYTYLLQSMKDGKFYTGYTRDLRKRFSDHNSGKVFSTKGRGPFRIIYYEACLDEDDAKAREIYLNPVRSKQEKTSNGVKTGMGKRYLKTRLKRFLSLTGR
jgi:putative endonuclease